MVQSARGEQKYEILLLKAAQNDLYWNMNFTTVKSTEHQSAPKSSRSSNKLTDSSWKITDMTFKSALGVFEDKKATQILTLFS